MIRRFWPFSRGGVQPPPLSADAPQTAPSEPVKDIPALEAILRAATPGKTVELDDVFVGQRIVPREHEWYYGARCRWCQRTAAALHDPNEGQIRLSFSGRGAIHFRCHHCNGLLKAPLPQILWFQFEG
jgi:hypothetical protein